MSIPPTPPVDPKAETSPGNHRTGDAPAPSPLQRFGDYTIISIMGEGGMGVVYLAEQANPRRTVALKVIRPGTASPAMLRRFEHEALILGRLQHPGIAQIYEAGAADTGSGLQPFYAMELVRGMPLTDFVRARGLSIRERLHLFSRICDAVQHAHTKGVIHRDLKPANILVDESGQPKVLDFGVARFAQAEPGTTQHTDIGQLIGTLQYMSPEQVGGDPGDLDTRSDVYALGVILYEILAERTPYPVNRAALADAIATIRNQEPPRLSSISRIFRGDIETIVNKALEKEKNRRYQSAGDLGADVRRYLNDEPVVAHPPTALYQLRKFAARHKSVVAGISLGVVMLSAATILASRQAAIATHQRDRAIEAERLAESRLIVAERSQRAEAQARELAQNEAARAQAVSKFLSDMLAAADPDNARGRRVLVSDVLESAAERVKTAFPNQPLVEAAVRYTIGATYISLGDEKSAEPHVDQSLDFRTRLLGPAHPDTIDSLGLLATLRGMQGRNDQSGSIHRDVLDRCLKTFGANHRTTLVATGNYALFLIEEGRLDEASTLIEPAILAAASTLGAEDRDALQLLYYRGMILSDQGKAADAERVYRQVYDARRRTLGDDHPDTIIAMHGIGLTLKEQSKFDEAERFYRESIERMSRVLGPRNPALLTTRDNLAGLLYQQRKTAESISLFAEVVTGRRERLGEEHPATLTSMNNLAAILLQDNQLDRAEPLFRQVLEVQLRTVGKDNPRTIGTRHNLASLLRDRGDFAQAEPMFREVLADRRRTQGIQHPDSLRAAHGLAQLLLELKNYDEAEPLILEELSTAREVLGPTHAITLGAHHLYARCLYESGKPEEAEPVIRALISRSQAALPPTDYRPATYKITHGSILIALQKHAEAEPILLDAHTRLTSTLGPADPNTKAAAKRLREVYTALNRPDDAAKFQ